MSEICKKPITLQPSEEYSNTTESVAHVFTESHSLCDILRYAIDQAGGDVGEIETLLELMGSSYLLNADRKDNHETR